VPVTASVAAGTCLAESVTPTDHGDQIHPG
jgi:hypothetical protein